MALSLSPRYDLFRFLFPDTFLSPEIKEKYKKMLLKNPGIVTDALSLLNESIQSIQFPGFQNLTITQQQPGKNMIVEKSSKNRSFGRINIEGTSDYNYMSPVSPLANISREITVTLRHIQGFITYFMIYEEMLYRYSRPVSYRREDRMNPCDPEFRLQILSESGNIFCTLVMKDVYISGMDGIDLSYSKLTRDSSTFSITFKFNNIDIEFYDES